MVEVKDRNILDRFCLDYCRVLETHQLRYVVVSGFVAIASGRTRGTEDIDVIVERLPLERFSQLHAALEKEGFECLQSNEVAVVFSYLRENNPVRYVRKGTLLPEMELKLAKDELDEYQLMTRQKLPLTGLDVWFSTVNVNVAFKEELLKSDKDMEDAAHLRIVYEDLIDEREIARVKDMIRRLRL